MAFNLSRLLSTGRRVARIVRTVSQAQQRSRRRAPARPDAGHAPRSGEVTDYRGDFRGTARVEYDPVPGPEAGPGEVVWTWVPFEELDGRGKDRPVLVVGRSGRHLLAVQLTSRDRNNARQRDEDYLDIGTGPWDRQSRPSEVRVDRILQVNPRDIRREGGVLDEAVYARVADALRRENGWS